MGGTSTSSKLQDLGRQVWHLPHVRMAVFDQLCEPLAHGSAPDEKEGFLKRFLTLNRDTSLDIAFRLYPHIRLDDFPWDCPDEVGLSGRVRLTYSQDRRRAYAAGVRVINVTGCLPLCAQWASFPEMLDFFPNVLRMFFDSTDLSFETRPCHDPLASWLPNLFEIAQTARVEDDGSITEPAPFYDIDGYDYELARDLRSGYQMGEIRPIIVREDGQTEFPAIFLQPQRKMVIEPCRGEHGDWLRLLQHRKAAQLPIQVLKWGMGVGEELSVVPRLARAVPPGLRILRLRLGSYGPLTATLDNIMAIIDTHHFPDLRLLEVTLLFYEDSVMEAEVRRPGYPIPPWLVNEIPEQLEISVKLLLLCHRVNEHLNERFVENALLGILPLRWFEQAKRMLGQDNWFRLRVQTYWDKGEGPERFSPPRITRLLWFGPPGCRPSLRTLQLIDGGG